MGTKKFKTNLISLLNLFENLDEAVDFRAKKKAFNDDFVKEIVESDYLKSMKNFDKDFNVKEVEERLHYEIAYNKKKSKISVDITKNDVFSYTDTEDELFKKMDRYILNEDYEKAQILQNYFKTIEINYM